MPGPTHRRVLVTGATGFIGHELVPRLRSSGWQVTAGLRYQGQPHCADADVVLGELKDYGDPDLSGFDAVVHLAARVHDNAASEADFHRENVLATEALGRSAARARVGMFVFLSTVKVFGEGRPRPYSVVDPADPQDAYARSKWEAEQRLADIPDLPVAVIRSPLVHGPDSKANLHALLSLSDKPIPIPLSSVHNRRSLVGIDNLCSLIEALLDGPAGTYSVRDGYDPSTGGLVSAMRRIARRPDPRLPVPASVLRPLLGPARSQKLLASLTVDDRPTRELVHWAPERTFEQGLHFTVTGKRRRKRLLMLVTEDWYFWSHRVDLARAAIAAGWDVHLACRVTDHGQRIQDAGVILHPLAWSRSEPAQRTLAAVPTLVSLYRDVTPDIAHHVAVKPVVVGAAVARRTKVPVVINALAGTGSVLADHGATASVLRRGVRRALSDERQWLVVQNRDDQRFLSTWTKPDRSVLIPGSGVDTTAFRAHPEPPPPVVVALVSRMLVSKGPADAVEAVTALRQDGHAVELLLVGDTDDGSEEALARETLRRWAQQPGITWTGRIENVADIWRRAHIAVLPSTYGEGMPKSLLEAGASGRPLVAYDNAGVRDLVINDRTGILVPAGDIGCLADALLRLAVDKDLRLRLGAGARRLVVTQFGDRRINRDFLELYDSALGLGPQGRN